VALLVVALATEDVRDVEPESGVHAVPSAR
jgi:hypothetical protein